MKELDTNNNQKTGLLETLKIIGPGVIVAAVVVGPGSVTTASSMGAGYGYTGLWLIVLACIFSYFYQEAAIRITMYKEHTFFEAIRLNIAPGVSKGLFVLVYVVMLIAQASNFIGAGMAMNYFVPQLSITAWAGILILLAIIIVLMNKENILDNFTKILVFLMVLAFVITAVVAQPNMSELTREGFSFKIPGGEWMLALGLFSTTMVPDTPLASSVLNKERYFLADTDEAKLPRSEKMRRAKLDLGFGLIITGLITASILICSAAVLRPQGLTVNSAADMAMQLTPLLGSYAGILFSLGLWAAAFSSGAYRIRLMADYFNFAWGYEKEKPVMLNKAISVVAGLVPLILSVVFGGAPIALVVFAQATLGILLPIITLILWVLVNNKKYLGDVTNNLFQNIMFAILFVITLSLAVRTFMNIVL